MYSGGNNDGSLGYVPQRLAEVRVPLLYSLASGYC